MLTIIFQLALFSQATGAQGIALNVDQLPVSSFRSGTYDFNRGFQEEPYGNRAIGPDVLFDNRACPAYYWLALTSNPSKQELLDEGGLPFRGSSGTESVNGIEWEYCELGYSGNYDSVLCLYERTQPQLGPPEWIPGMPSFPSCTYLISGLPGGGCWNIGLDLSGGFECSIPQTGAPGAAYFGWSVTPLSVGSFSGHPVATNLCPGYGTSNSLDWRDWDGHVTGTPYTFVGSFIGGTAPKVRADLRVTIHGNPQDVSPVYGSEPGDSLHLSTTVEPDPGITWPLLVDGAPAGLQDYVLLCSPGAPQGVVMSSNSTTWTRQCALPVEGTHALQATGPSFSILLHLPPSVSVGRRAQCQLVQIVGPAKPANVAAASNGLDFYL